MTEYNIIKERIFKLLNFDKVPKISIIHFEEVSVSFDGTVAQIGCCSKETFARGCFLLAKELSKGNKAFSLTQKKAFADCSAMIDVSRGGVMRPERVKEFITCLSALGMNVLMLYTEDTYELEGYPCFGYLRGRYTLKELKEMDDYAFEMGVELIPCIQTLGHLEQYMLYPEAELIADTTNVLLVDSEDSYVFIEQAISTMRSAFRSERIHIGMDEANSMGLGKYLKQNGYHDRFELFNRHLNRVREICLKHNFRPMIWSDMYFKLGSKNELDYDPESKIPQNVVDCIPDVDLVYWDYYHTDYSFYDKLLKMHQSLGRETYFAGAVWTCDGFIANGEYTIKSMVPAMRACLENKVPFVLATLWSNDGCETDHFQSLNSMSVFSEYCYRQESCTYEDIMETAAFLTGADQKLLETISDFHLGYDGNVMMGKRFVYADLLHQKLLWDIDCEKSKIRYQNALSILEQPLESGKFIEKEYYCMLFKIVKEKSALFFRLRKEYKDNNRSYLANIVENTIPQLLEYYEALHAIHKKQWLKTYKPFGFEVLDIRYGGLRARLLYASMQLQNYLEGKIDLIEELEQEQLIGVNIKWPSAGGIMQTEILV